MPAFCAKQAHRLASTVCETGLFFAFNVNVLSGARQPATGWLKDKATTKEGHS